MLPTPLPPALEGAVGLSFLERHLKTKTKRFWLFNGSSFICGSPPPFQSLEPLPASGPDFGALGEEAEFVEVEPEAKQEILENKDVRTLWRARAPYRCC